jgi:hypothetical protein
VPAAVAALGDAYLLQGSVGLARNEFRKLTDASQYGERWRGEGYDGLGRCDLAEKKWEAAGQNFTVAFQAGVRRAHVGYARSQTGRKNYQLAVDSLERQFFLKKPEFDRVEADAHLAAGEAYEAWGGDHLWDAVYQYLWVSALYGVYRAEEAQALARAASLLDRLGAKEDAAQVLRRLRDKYPNSPPASKG